MKIDNQVEIDLNPSTKLEESNITKVQFTKLRRYLILLVISIAALLAPLGSTIYFPAQKSLTNELTAPGSLYDISVSVFMINLAIFPLIWGNLADRFGRKGPLAVALVIALVGFLVGALANSIEVIIISRVLGAVGSAAPLVTGVGIINDIFLHGEIGFAMSLFFVGVLLGPVIGPIIGGILDQFLGWRSIFWFLSIHCGVILILILFFIPETLPTSSRQPYPFTIDRKLRIRRSGPLFNPFRPLIYMQYPAVLMISLVYALPFGAFFGVESFHSRAMKEIYHLEPSQAGLSYLVLGMGGAVGNVVGGYLSDLLYQRRLKVDSESTPLPELRLNGIWFCVLFTTVGLVMYAWFLQFHLHLALTLAASFLIGFGYASGSVGCTTYLVGVCPTMASSITGCAIFFRMMTAGIVSSFDTLVIENLDHGYGTSLYALLSALAIPLVIVVQFRGDKLRQSYGP